MSEVKYGIVMPVYDALRAVELAVEAEQAGWDGFFMADGMWGLDSWLCLSAAAMRTTRIRLGTLITPLSVMRPWKLAAEAATLDNLSNGRAIVSIGMGAIDTGFAGFGEITDLRTRAELVDEGLDIVTKMWRGEPFQHQGKHYQLDVTDPPPGTPPPVQKPGIPIWMVAAWPRPKSMQRALRCAGIIPVVKPKNDTMHAIKPDDLREVKGWIDERREHAEGFDYVIEGHIPVDEDQGKAQALIDSWTDAGMTWWIESLWDAPRDQRHARLLQGPLR